MANTSTGSGMHLLQPTRATQNELAFIQEVRARAYDLSESRGVDDGYDLDDWLLAGQQVGSRFFQ